MLSPYAVGRRCADEFTLQQWAVAAQRSSLASSAPSPGYVQSYVLLIHYSSSLISDICLYDNNNNPDNRDPESFTENVSQLKAACAGSFAKSNNI